VYSRTLSDDHVREFRDCDDGQPRHEKSDAHLTDGLIEVCGDDELGKAPQSYRECREVPHGDWEERLHDPQWKQSEHCPREGVPTHGCDERYTTTAREVQAVEVPRREHQEQGWYECGHESGIRKSIEACDMGYGLVPQQEAQGEAAEQNEEGRAEAAGGHRS
jgi:hypothetical protein